jgi:hypothetical protein
VKTPKEKITFIDESRSDTLSFIIKRKKHPVVDESPAGYDPF